MHNDLTSSVRVTGFTNLLDKNDLESLKKTSASMIESTDQAAYESLSANSEEDYDPEIRSDYSVMIYDDDEEV